MNWVTVRNADGMPQAADGHISAPTAPGLGVCVRIETLGDPIWRLGDWAGRGDLLLGVRIGKPIEGQSQSLQ